MATVQKKTHHEHVLLRPDTYVGAITAIKAEMPVVRPLPADDTSADAAADAADTKDESKQKRAKKESSTQFEHLTKEVSYVPALYKIFDEILVNAADNKARDPTMRAIKVNFNPETGAISVWNDGKSVAVREATVTENGEPKTYLEPELIFGHLLTSHNFDDTQKRLVGGRNGYGAKLTNIFSTEFVVEINDTTAGLAYKQTWRNNMMIMGKPATKKATHKTDWTRVTFTPDYARFGMTELDEDIMSLFLRRILEMTALDITVYLQDEKLPFTGLKKYMQLVCPGSMYVQVNERWEVGLGPSAANEFQQTSLVNGVATTLGGPHVQEITSQLAAYAKQALDKRKIATTPAVIRKAMHLFIVCRIENPTFDSQTKERLTLPAAQWGSTCVLTEAQLKQLVDKSGVLDKIVELVSAKELKELAKTTTSRKVRQLTGIPKLEDANEAGGKHSSKCTLFLTEGDSAKALAMAGMCVVGRDHYGVFPLRGKLLNVRDATHKQLTENAELKNLVTILGLQHGKDYSSAEDRKSLRYGHVVVMADQDSDGSHIRGLLINFFEHLWPSLLECNEFLAMFITPIICASSGKKKRWFYTLAEYEAAVECKGWRTKHYKGLGTSTPEEAKMYFRDMPKHMITLKYLGDLDKDSISLAFSKARADDRKGWLQNFSAAHCVPDYSTGTMTYRDFVNKELINFSMADNRRSIPSAIDGLKPSQRKVLYACFKRKLHDELKVAQLGGYVAEHTAYHHGEDNLFDVITGMAQDYVGANNLNLLEPIGQFGTRHEQGADRSSPRYIFTMLSKLTRLIFPKEDDAVLTYLEDEGTQVEPDHFVPIIPMVLVNGAEGIGTGFSTFVPQYSVREIITELQQYIQFDADWVLLPAYRGFKGTVVPIADKPGRFVCKGVCTCVSSDDATDTYHVTELPIGMKTSAFKAKLEEHLDPGKIVDIKNNTDVAVNVTVKVSKAWTDTVEISKVLDPVTHLATTNMTLFDADQKLRRFNTIKEIVVEFAKVRRALYEKRKAHMLGIYAHDLAISQRKIKFIELLYHGKLVLHNRPRATIEADMTALGLSASLFGLPVAWDPKYETLLSMPLSTLTLERIGELRALCDKLHAQIDELTKLTTDELWLADLEALDAAMGKADGEDLVDPQF